MLEYILSICTALDISVEQRNNNELTEWYLGGVSIEGDYEGALAYIAGCAKAMKTIGLIKSS